MGWKVLLIAALAVTFFSLLQIFLVYPRFLESAVTEAKEEAVKDGQHMLSMIPLGLFAGQIELDEKLERTFRKMARDFKLWKIKLFNAEGKVIYSSVPEEIGTFNTKDYFFNHVARGNIFAKTVWRKQVTMEDQVVPIDVVETYIPIMDGTTFLGAWEIYSDVTERRSRIIGDLRRASAITIGAASILLAAMAFLAARTEAVLHEKERLQEELVRADRLAAVGTLASGIAHEFNNINVTVMGFSQLALEQKGLSPILQDHLERINRASQRAKAITGNLLDFSRSGKGTFARENLVDAVRETLALVKDQFEKDGIEFREALVDVPDSPMDRGQIVQVILNLLNNARHSMEGCDVKRLTIVTGREEKKVFVSVSDTGCGIEEEHLSDIFTPFYTTKGEHARDEAQAKIKGTGLGLSVSHSIVNNHGGSMTVESSVGEGTTISVILPLDTEAGGDTETPSRGPESV